MSNPSSSGLAGGVLPGSSSLGVRAASLGLFVRAHIGEESFQLGERAASATVRIVAGDGVTSVGWTLNMQSSHGVRGRDIDGLADWLRLAAML